MIWSVDQHKEVQMMNLMMIMMMILKWQRRIILLSAWSSLNAFFCSWRKNLILKRWLKRFHFPLLTKCTLNRNRNEILILILWHLKNKKIKCLFSGFHLERNIFVCENKVHHSFREEIKLYLGENYF